MAEATAKAERAKSLLESAEVGIFHVRPHDEVLNAARQAEALFREVGDMNRAIQAVAVTTAALFRRDALDEVPHEAVKLAEETLASCTERGDRYGEAVMKIALAEINLDRRGDEKRKEALEMAKDAKAVFIDVGDRAMEARATEAVAMVLIKLCDRSAGPKVAKEALKYARNAALICQEIGNKRGEAKALYFVFCSKMYGEATFKDGLKYAKEAAAIFAEIGCKWWQGTVLRMIAEWAQIRGQGEEGIPYAEESLQIFREVEDNSGGLRRGWEANSLTTLVGAYSFRNDGIAKAVQVAQEGVEKLKATGDTLTMAQAWSVLMSAHMLAEEYEPALHAAEESLALYRELRQKTCEVRMMREISELLAKLDRKSEAFASYEEGNALAQEIGDVRLHARNLSAMVRLHLDNSEPMKALEVAAEAISLYQQCEDKEGEGVVLLNMSTAHCYVGNDAAAVAEAEEAKAVFQALENRDREAQANVFLADILLRMGRPEQAIHAATAAKVLFYKLGSKVDEASMLHMIAQCSMAIGDKAMESERNEDQRRARKLFMGALRAAKEGLALARKLPIEKDPKRMLHTGLLMAVAQGQGIMGKFKEAVKAVGEVQRMAVENTDREGEVNGMILMAQIHQWNDRLDDARVYASSAFDLAQKFKDQYLVDMCVEFLQHLDPQAQKDGRGSSQRPTAPAADFAASGAETAMRGEIGPYRGPSADALIPKINEMAMGLLAVDELHQDQPLMDSGLDSLSMVQFRNTLQQQFPGVPMPASLIFDFPSVRAVAENIADELKSAHEFGRPLM